MKRRRFISLTLGVGGLAALSHLFPRGWQRVEHRAWALGVEVSLIVCHPDRARADRAAEAALQALDALEDVLSLYRGESQICQLNRTGVLESPHPDLATVLGQALEWSRLSQGAFDPTVQPLWAVHARGHPPSSAEIEAARRRVGWRQVRLDATRIQLGAGQAITLNGIAQGFAADRVRAVLRAHGIQQALVNTGEYAALGGKDEARAWRVGIQHPRARGAYVAVAALHGRALATSGDYETKFADDFSSHHIFDPATGRSPDALSSVTVLASSGLEADALSTAMFVLGPSRGLDLAASRGNVDAFLVLKDGSVRATAGFPGVS